MLTVYIDFKSPASYLALDPTLALAERVGIAVSWRPFRTHERDIPDQVEDESVARTHRRVRAEATRATHIKYAVLRGMDLRFPTVAHDTDLALGILSELSGDPIDYIRAAFAAYWERHLDLNTESVVVDLIKTSGVSHGGTLSTALASLDAAQAEAEEQGVVDAPAYVIDGQVFIGRQHLPWIEETARSTARAAF
jgi:2-hydroxychromene-2-carboxylate isomerase